MPEEEGAKLSRIEVVPLKKKFVFIYSSVHTTDKTVTM